MAKFDLKKAILENKATFFSSLTEGQFSWMTQDTGQQIGSQDENMIPVYMFDDKGKYYYESDYDGYGVFGGMDYYELLDKMNGGEGDRGRGIDLAFGKEKTSSEVLFPALVTKPNGFNYKSHDFTQEPESDPNQSWYTPEEDDFYDQNDEEEYGDNEDEEDDMMEGLNEGKMYFHVLEDGGYGDIGHQGVYNTKEEAQNKADKLADMFPSSSFYVEASDSKDEPYNVTMEGKKKYYKDAEADDAEHIKALEKDMKDDKKSGKMKMSEFKAKIKEITVGGRVFDEDQSITTEKALKIAEALAKYMTRFEGGIGDKKFTVNRGSVNGPSFDLDLGGSNHSSYVILKSGTITNVANNVHVATYHKERAQPDINYPGYVIDNDGSEIGVLSHPVTENKSTKMKKSELKAKIKEMVLNEMESNNMEDAPENEVDFLAELEGMLNEAEDEETEEVTDDVTTDDVAVDDTETIDTETTTEVNPDVKAVQDSLTQAQAAAQKLGDPKLTDQIGNTITFFTRNHVVEKGAVAEADKMEEEILNESMFPMLKRILK